MAKYKTGNYKTSYFPGLSNSNFNFILCEDKTVIPLIIQKYVLN